MGRPGGGNGDCWPFRPDYAGTGDPYALTESEAETPKPPRNPPLPPTIAVDSRNCCEITGIESSNQNKWLRGHDSNLGSRESKALTGLIGGSRNSGAFPSMLLSASGASCNRVVGRLDRARSPAS